MCEMYIYGGQVRNYFLIKGICTGDGRATS